MNLKFLFFFSFFLTVSSLVGQNGPKIIGAGGTVANMSVTSSPSSNGSISENTIIEDGFLPNLNAASRFLGHATLGADYETIEGVAKMGIENWLDEQLAMPINMSVKGFTSQILGMAADSILNMGGSIPNNFDESRNYWHFAWWQYTMTQPDLLRNRVALALSEIFVVSEFPDLEDQPLGLADFYDLLLKNSFGNYRDLLYDVTMHPSMGFYLTSVNNFKTTPEFNRFPDENYAREVMQLFSIGLFELNEDGSQKTFNGQPIPTYGNAAIIEFAKIFTGLTWGNAGFVFGRDAINKESFTQPLKMLNFYHEPGPKFLLKGQVVPDRSPTDGMADINDAIDNLFNHPNVGPFIGYRLIQRLVTSNPSPEYIARVTAVFNDNGNGERGDLKAVIKAILLDEEAINCPFQDGSDNGRLREPIVRYTQLSRAFNATVETGLYRNTMNNFYDRSFQRPLAARTVFNFFTPTFKPNGAVTEMQKVAPEFQITDALTITGYANELYEWLMDENLMQYADIFSGEDNLDSKKAYLNLDDEIALQDVENIPKLIDRLDLILSHGQMTDFTKQEIIKAVQSVPESRKDQRVKLAIYLIMISPDYLIIR